MYATTNPRSDPSSIQILVTLTSDWLSLANDDRGLEPNDFSGHCVQNGEYRYSPVTKAILHALQRNIDRAVCANKRHSPCSLLCYDTSRSGHLLGARDGGKRRAAWEASSRSRWVRIFSIATGSSVQLKNSAADAGGSVAAFWLMTIVQRGARTW